MLQRKKPGIGTCRRQPLLLPEQDIAEAELSVWGAVLAGNNLQWGEDAMQEWVAFTMMG